MYKRRTKSGNLGIIRSTSKTQKTTTNIYQNINTSLSSKENELKNVVLDGSNSPSKHPPSEDSDEVYSDSEPSSKKSRRFIGSSSSGMKSLSINNTKNRSSPVKTNISKHFDDIVHSDIHNKTVKDISQTITKKKKETVKSSNVGRPSLDVSRGQQESPENYSKRTKKNKETLLHTSEVSRPIGDVGQQKHVNKGTGNLSKQTYMEELLKNSGLLLSDGNSPNILQTDQAMFVRDINTAISSDKKEIKQYVEYIMKDLEEYCSNDKCLMFAISRTETASECDVSRGDTQDSLMRLLLNVDCLQAPVAEFLMEKLAKLVMDGTNGDGDTPVITWVRMILQCFRFLDRMLNACLVNERLLDIVLATSDVTVQQEVVLSLPDIISDAEHHHTALQLSKLVRKSSPQLLASTLEALTNLSLQSEVRAEVVPVLMKALHKVQPEFLPTMLKFLFSDCDVHLMDEIISYLRTDLDITEARGDTASIQVLLFTTLRDALLASRTLSHVWQKNISSIKTQAEHKPMDVVMLIVLLSTTNDPVRQRSIESVFRNRIRLDMFTEPLIIETLKNYISVIKEHFHVTIKLAGTLLKATEPVVVEFASKMYIGMFVNMDGLWCKWVLTELQVCVGAGDTNVARAALNILQHLTNNYLNRVKPLGVILILLLNKLNDLALNEVCQLMDILCHIAYSDNDFSLSDCSILQDEINILVQKQLASSQLSVLRSGVVGCVMAVKHIASMPKDSSEPCSLNSEETPENGKKAVQLLEMLLSSTRNCMEAYGLALDQLSHLLISGSVLEPFFIKKLSSLMRDNLQDAFLISSSDFISKDDVIQSSLQFQLDDDCEGSIALNLSELVAMEGDPAQQRSMVGVSCLHPLLRLLRGLEMSDLSEIDALLGCAIAMPAPTAYSQFSQLSPYQQHIALHCLFHCINWLCEIINCFAYLVKKNEPEKILMRLRTVVWLRELLTRCLPLAMEYTPPTCHFQTLPKLKMFSSEKTSKKGSKKGKKKGKKKQEDKESILTGNENTSQTGEDEEEEAVEEKVADLVKYKHYFRELDIDVWLILTQPLTLSPTPGKAGQFTPELGPSELLFLLDDYVAKLTRALTPSNKRMSFLKTAANQPVGFENLDKFTPLHLAKNTIKLLPFLCSFLEKTIEYTKNLVIVNDGIFDSTGMFMDGSAEIKKCQGKLFKVLAVLFSWVGFQNQANSNYLLAGLQKMANRVSCEQSKVKSKKGLVRECVQYLNQCHEHVLDLTSACTMVDLIKALVYHADDDVNLSTNIASICKELLGRRWYDVRGNREKGAVLNSQIGELLTSYLSHSEDQLSVVTTTSSWLATESQLLTDKDATLSTFPAFSKINLYLLIGGLLKGLEGGVKQKLENQLSDKEQLELWSSFTLCLETLVTVIKAHDSKSNLRVFMKGCTTVLRLFLSHGMSTCTFMFKHEAATVSQILKKLQVTTRYIQTICNFVKVSKDAALTQFLPPIRAVMETILLRVKSIIVINNCSDAFFMGSMKNRDLKGQEILTQESQAEEEEEIEGLPNETDSESDKEEIPSNATDDEENEETGESVSI